MPARHITPILNVSDLEESFAWCARLGWTKDWDFGDPPDFGSVSRGESVIFLCQDGQGSPGSRRPQSEDADYANGVWMFWWLTSPAEVDAMHAQALAQGVMVSAPPGDKPWNVRECELRHPDGHTFRVGASTETEE